MGEGGAGEVEVLLEVVEGEGCQVDVLDWSEEKSDVVWCGVD